IAILADETVVRKTREFYREHSWVNECVALGSADSSGPPSAAELIRRLREQNLDCLILSPESKMPAWIPDFCHIPHRVGYASDARQRRHLNWPVALPSGTRVRDLHWVDVLDGYARTLGLRRFRGPASHVPFLRLAELATPPAERPSPSIAMHIGGNEEWNRRWPLEKFQQLCGALIGEKCATVHLVGGASEAPEHRVIMAAMEERGAGGSITSLAGRTLRETAACIRQARLFVGNDSGPMNVAVALGTPVVAIRGADPENFRADRVDRKHAVISGWSRCGRHLDDTHVCPRGCPVAYERERQEYPRCIDEITFEQVWTTVEQQLARTYDHDHPSVGSR